MTAARDAKGNRRECPKCGGLLRMDCVADETIWFASCEDCDYNEIPKKVKGR